MTEMCSRKKIIAVVGAAVLAAGMLNSSASAQVVRHSQPGDLFYNYYVPPVGPCSAGAELYPCPRPTPPLVGHTYVTYQPLMPHEFMYRHSRHYTTFHEDAPPTHTCVHWGCIR
jgi:hypothetical protein